MGKRNNHSRKQEQLHRRAERRLDVETERATPTCGCEPWLPHYCGIQVKTEIATFKEEDCSDDAFSEPCWGSSDDGSSDPPQPQLYGAAPMHYHRGVAIATMEQPPWWAPELEDDPVAPYHVDLWIKDVRRWCAMTKVGTEIQGNLLAMSLGTTARQIADEIPETVLSNGAVMDLDDGNGTVQRTGIDILIAVLRSKFPPDAEAALLRAGLAFSTFTPSRDE